MHAEVQAQLNRSRAEAERHQTAAEAHEASLATSRQELEERDEAHRAQLGIALDLEQGLSESRAPVDSSDGADRQPIRSLRSVPCVLPTCRTSPPRMSIWKLTASARHFTATQARWRRVSSARRSCG